MATLTNMNDRTLPARFYTDPDILAHEKEELFFKSWYYVCHVSAVSEPGQFKTASIFDQDVFVVRGNDGELRAFYNVCPHRGHRLVDGTGQQRRITCPYHAWTYNLDGQLFRARETSGQRTFKGAEICLSTVRVEQLLDFVFVNLDHDALPLSVYVSGLEDHVLSVIPNLSEYRPRIGVDYFGGGYNCNWKVVIDNFMECYHCEVAHKSFGDMMNVPGNRFTFHGNYSYQFLPGAKKADNAAYFLDLEEDDLDGHFWYIFPNTIFSIFPGTKNFSVSRADPIGPEETLRFFDTLSPEGVSVDREKARAKWGLEVVNEEDKALCENVQRGMRQRGFNQGYYLIDPENQNLTEEGVQFFHDLYRARMTV